MKNIKYPTLISASNSANILSSTDIYNGLPALSAGTVTASGKFLATKSTKKSYLNLFAIKITIVITPSQNTATTPKGALFKKLIWLSRDLLLWKYFSLNKALKGVVDDFRMPI